jgi:hypothetical protein
MGEQKIVYDAKIEDIREFYYKTTALSKLSYIIIQLKEDDNYSREQASQDLVEFMELSDLLNVTLKYKTNQINP